MTRDFKQLMPLENWRTLDLIGAVIHARGNRREVLISDVFVHATAPIFRARVSCDGGGTWGWHEITKRELMEVER